MSFYIYFLFDLIVFFISEQDFGVCISDFFFFILGLILSFLNMAYNNVALHKCR